MNRLFEFISSPSNSRTTSLLVILIIALSIPLTVFVAQKQQELRQQAASECNPGLVCSGWSYTTCYINEGKSCGTLGGKCVSGSCTVETDLTIIDPAGQSFCQTSGYHPVCATHDVPGECYPGKAPDTSICSKIPSNPPFSGGTYVGQSSDGSTVIWFDPATGKNRTFLNGTEQFTSSSTPVPAVVPPTPAPATSAPAVGGPALAITCPKPLGTIPGTPHEGNTEDWGGQCPEGGQIARAIPGTCNCTVALCKRYSGGPLCWVNTGQTYGQINNDVAGCIAKGAGLSSSCSAPTPTPPCSSSNCSFGAGNICINNQCVPRPNQVNCTVTPTCPSGFSAIGFPSNQKYACVNDLNPNAPTNVSPTCPGATPTPTPSGVTPTPTPTPAPGSTQLAFILGLNGLGRTGDQKNPSSHNISPRSDPRNFKIEIFNASGANKIKDDISADLSLDANGKFSGTVDAGVLATGTYVIKIKSASFVKKKVTINVTEAGQTISVPALRLANGNINGDRFVDVLDFNRLRNCLFKSAQDACASSDLDDNGEIDLFDFNLLLREFGQEGD